jgi:hypothetical protein
LDLSNIEYVVFQFCDIKNLVIFFFKREIFWGQIYTRKEKLVTKSTKNWDDNNMAVLWPSKKENLTNCGFYQRDYIFAFQVQFFQVAKYQMCSSQYFE